MSEQRFTLDTFDVETFRFQNVGKTVYSKGTGLGWSFWLRCRVFIRS